MSERGERSERPVVVVTGGGGGIGAAIATELGRRGSFVVTVDPLVSLDGSAALPQPEETTAGRIVAAGGAARASSISVTDADAVGALFHELVDDHGRLDAVVNVAGITRPTSFARGSEEDWQEVLAVHLGGYLNVLRAALPIMAAAGRGRVLGVTSGSGWRAADAGAYSCAKRAVAALTWQIGRVAPPGVTINAISPIAVTRMVTDALARAAAAAPTGGSGAPRPSSTGGLSLGSMPQPEELAPLGAHLVGADLDWLSGHVLFTAGSEVALVSPPRLLEVVSVGSDDLPEVLEVATSVALAPAEAAQATTGGSNPRLSYDVTPSPGEQPGPAMPTCAVVSDRRDLLLAITKALADRGVTITSVPVGGALGAVGTEDLVPSQSTSFGDGARALAEIGSVDAVVVAIGGAPSAVGLVDRWERVLAEHDEVPAWIACDAGWARAVADASAAADRPKRLVTLVDARTAGGRSRAQAAAQLSRAARKASGDRVAALVVSVETSDVGWAATGQVAAHLVCSPAAVELSGAEMVLDDGWFGVRSHPRPATSVAFGGPDLPRWLDDVVRSLVAAPEETA